MVFTMLVQLQVAGWSRCYRQRPKSLLNDPLLRSSRLATSQRRRRHETSASGKGLEMKIRDPSATVIRYSSLLCSAMALLRRHHPCRPIWAMARMDSEHYAAVKQY